jgi:hypothetical protein
LTNHIKNDTITLGDSNMSEQEIEAIFGRDSSKYKEAVQLGKIEVEKRKNEAPDPLNVSLNEAAHLTPEVKEKYIKIAEYYLKDLHDNIFKNQFELNKSYPDISVDDWNDFLNDKIVSVYVNKHKRTLLKAAAEDNLANPVARNKRDSLQLIRNIEEQENSENNKNICIIRIPDIYEGAE